MAACLGPLLAPLFHQNIALSAITAATAATVVLPIRNALRRDQPLRQSARRLDDPALPRLVKCPEPYGRQWRRRRAPATPTSVTAPSIPRMIATTDRDDSDCDTAGGGPSDRLISRSVNPPTA